MPFTFGKRSLTLLILILAAFLITSTLYDDSRAARLSRESDSVGPVQAQPQDYVEREDIQEPREHGPPAALESGYDDRPDAEEYMRDMLIWQRPENRDHWPPYSDFAGRDYDPNRWEAFEEYVLQFRLSPANRTRERGYYINSGSRQFEESHSAFERLYSPYPDYQSAQYRELYHGQFVSCVGPRGKPLNDSQEDAVKVYDSVPNGFPAPLVGSAEAVGLNAGLCIDRVQRFGPYGMEQSGRSVDWPRVDWGSLQEKCIAQNKDRFSNPLQELETEMSEALLSKVPGKEHSDVKARETQSNPHKLFQSRSAVLIRSWEGYDYSENDIMSIRAMITELSLQSGGEFQVFLMVNVKDRSEPIFTDARAYKRMLDKSVPQELRSIAVLWSEEICEKLYPDVGDWQVYWQQFMPIQWFSETHPEFEYFWNLEMDMRYIGSWYHLLTQTATFAARQPRKYLWERSARFYIPSHHGRDFAAFINDTNAIIRRAAAAGSISPVWGPHSSTKTPLGPRPPHAEEDDDFEWGVGEEADLVTLLPMWDPVKTHWTMRNKLWNYAAPGIRPHFSDSNPTDDGFDHPLLAGVPRRAYINTAVRLSRGLLGAMHAESAGAGGRSMQAELWPSSVALHHGFKAVYAPHPVYSGRRWPARYADRVFNADGGVAARWGQEVDSVYNQDREVNFRSWSWYYHAEFPRVLYRRWMGWKAQDGLGNVGGREWEERGDERPGGRICMPPMLLHPIKRHDLD